LNTSLTATKLDAAVTAQGEVDPDGVGEHGLGRDVEDGGVPPDVAERELRERNPVVTRIWKRTRQHERAENRFRLAERASDELRQRGHRQVNAASVSAVFPPSDVVVRLWKTSAGVRM
jgi:hypothetical protein